MNEHESSNILIVDDNPTNLRVLVEYLRSTGYKTLVATGGDQAIRQLEHHTPDLILLDVMMPGIDGFETCRLIREKPNTADTPIIFMTALSDMESKVSGFKAGAVDYVTKPFQLEEVSVRIHTHLTIQRQKRELRELNATKDKFFSIIAHDLRGPFSGLLGFSQIFAHPNRELSQAQRNRFGALLHDSARNMYELLENLLAWARLEKNSLNISPVQMNLYDVTEKAIALLSHNADSKKIQLSNTIAADMEVYADPNAVSTILRNLITNAIKFTEPDGQIVVAATFENNVTQVSVSDNGIGMKEETSQQVFQSEFPLSTTGTREEIGTGLGLLISRELSALSGGEIWVESEEGQGSTFFFTLPTEDSERIVSAEKVTT